MKKFIVIEFINRVNIQNVRDISSTKEFEYHEIIVNG
jgi:ribosomal protein S17